MKKLICRRWAYKYCSLILLNLVFGCCISCSTDDDDNGYDNDGGSSGGGIQNLRPLLKNQSQLFPLLLLLLI